MLLYMLLLFRKTTRPKTLLKHFPQFNFMKCFIQSPYHNFIQKSMTDGANFSITIVWYTELFQSTPQYPHQLLLPCVLCWFGTTPYAQHLSCYLGHSFTVPIIQPVVITFSRSSGVTAHTHQAFSLCCDICLATDPISIMWFRFIPVNIVYLSSAKSSGIQIRRK